MSDKYRNKQVDEFMELLENDLTAIVGKEFANLDVKGVMNRNRHDDPGMSIDKATMWAMRDKAAIVMRKTIALATALDRMTVMVGQMADEMAADGNQNDEKYRNRLRVLTELDKSYRKLL